MNKQEKQILLEAAINNGYGIFPLPNYMFKPLAWLLDTSSELEFRGSAITQALSSYEHTNQWGQRLVARLQFDNMSVSQSTDIRNFIDQFSEKSKVYGSTTVSSATGSGTSVDIAATLLFQSARPANKALNGAIITGLTGGAVAITNSTYNAGTKIYTLTIAASRNWVLGDSVAITFPPNIPTVAVFDTKITGGDLSKKTKHFNVIRATFGTNRDYTINYQRCSIDLRGLENSSAIDSQITQVGI